MAAGPSTRIADLVIPENYAQYIQQETEVKSRLVQSGAVMMSDFLSGWLQTEGGVTVHVPSFQDLGDDPDRVGSDSIPAEYTGGTADPDPAKILTSDEIAVRLSRNNSWNAARLATRHAGADPLEVVAQRISDYRTRRLQDTWISIWKGIFADNDAAPTGTDTHLAEDMKLDISGVSYQPGVTDFSAEAAIDTVHTMGDSNRQLSIMMVHHVVEARMQKNNLIDTIPDARGEIQIARFLGGQVEVIVDDSMPFSNGVYETWFFGMGTTQLGMASLEDAFEIHRLPGAGNGRGSDTVYHRWEMAMHPTGHAYIGATTGGGPANSVLDDAASWSRVYPERKQIKAARLITRESA